MNSVCLIGNLTKEPDLRHTSGGTSVCTLRVAVNERYKQADQWLERANYFDVTVWSGQGEACAQYLNKGSRVGVQGRLRWEEWDGDDGVKRQKVSIVADKVDFLTSKGDNGQQAQPAAAQSQFPGASAFADDDIPFDLRPAWRGDPSNSALEAEVDRWQDNRPVSVGRVRSAGTASTCGPTTDGQDRRSDSADGSSDTARRTSSSYARRIAHAASGAIPPRLPLGTRRGYCASKGRMLARSAGRCQPTRITSTTRGRLTFGGSARRVTASSIALSLKGAF